MNKLQKVQKSARGRMQRFRRRRKASRFTQMVTRKAAQVGAKRMGVAAMPYVGTGLAVGGVVAELLDAFVDIPWYGQLLIGPLVGAGDIAFSDKVGALIP